jgi:rhamnosyltransferase
MARGEVLVYLTQDAEPAATDWLATLVTAVSAPQVAGACCRQLPRADATPPMRFMLNELYPATPARRRLEAEQEQLRLEDMFFSNVGSAIRADVWRKIPFRDRVVMSEDQYWAYDVLRAGYELVYEPNAAVLHSHNYSLRTLFARNRLSGSSLRGLIGDSAGGIAGRGLRYLARGTLPGWVRRAGLAALHGGLRGGTGAWVRAGDSLWQTGVADGPNGQRASAWAAGGIGFAAACKRQCRA